MSRGVSGGCRVCGSSPPPPTVGRWLASSALIIRPSVTVDREPEPAAEPVDDPGDTVPPSTVSFSDVAAGNQHTCGLRTDGTVVCWGDSDFSSCGLVTAQAAFSLTIVCDEEPGGRVRAAECAGRTVHGHLVRQVAYVRD